MERRVRSNWHGAIKKYRLCVSEFLCVTKYCWNLEMRLQSMHYICELFNVIQQCKGSA